MKIFLTIILLLGTTNFNSQCYGQAYSIPSRGEAVKKARKIYQDSPLPEARDDRGLTGQELLTEIHQLLKEAEKMISYVAPPEDLKLDTASFYKLQTYTYELMRQDLKGISAKLTQSLYDMSNLIQKDEIIVEGLRSWMMWHYYNKSPAWSAVYDREIAEHHYRSGNMTQSALLLGHCTRWWMDEKEYKLAHKYLEIAERMIEEEKDPAHRSQIIMARALLTTDEGDLVFADELYQEAIGMLDEETDRINLALNNYWAGKNAQLMRNEDLAISYMEESRRLEEEEYGYVPNIDVLLSLGDLYSSKSEIEKSRERLYEGIEVTKRLHDRWDEAKFYIFLSEIEQQEMNFSKALSLLEKPIRYYKEIDYAFGLSLCYSDKSYIYQIQGDFQNAEKFRLLADSLTVDPIRDLKNQFLYLEGLYIADRRENILEQIEELKPKVAESGNVDLYMKYQLLEVRMLNDIKYSGSVFHTYVKSYKSVKLAKEVEEHFRNDNDSLNLGQALTELGLAYYFKTRMFTSKRCLEEAADIFLKLGSIGSYSRTMSLLAILQGLKPNKSEAITTMEQTLDIIDSLFATRRGELGKAQLAKQGTWPLPYTIDLCIKNDDDEAGFRCMQRSKGRFLALLMRQALVDQKMVNDSNYKQILKLERTIGGINLLMEETIDSKRRQELQGQLRVVMNEHKRLQAQLREENPEYDEFARPPLIPLLDVQEKLDTNEVLIEYGIWNEGGYATVTTNKEIEFVNLGKKEKLEEAYTSFQEEFMKPYQVALNKGDFKALGKLEEAYGERVATIYKKTFRPLERKVDLAGKKLIVIPDGMIYGVPLEMLVRQGEPRKFSEYNYLLEEYPISYFPSTYAFHYHRSHTDSTQYQIDWLGMGKSTFADVPCAGKNLDPMPFMGDELESMGAPFQSSKVLLDGEATEARLRQMSDDQARILHISTHGILNDSVPELCKLSLSSSEQEDGCLYLFEVFRLKVKPESVSLEGCDTGLGLYQTGEGMVSFLRAFQYLGVQSTTLSLWKVRQDGSGSFFRKYYENLVNQAPWNYPEALRKAKLEMVTSSKYASPFFWAPYVMFGE